MSTGGDRLGRPMRSLRISVTDRCNLRCRYCMPREVFGKSFRFMPHSDLLRFEEIVRLVGIFATQGVNAVRITGGEPLLRRDIEHLIEQIAALEQIEDISLTTNGTLLARKARSLKEAGLKRVTVSLDALDQDAFRNMTDTDLPVDRVLAGIDEARAAGLAPVKVNMVVRRGINDHCVMDMAEHFRHRPEILRFIEFMDVGESNGWRLDEVLSAEQLHTMINARWALEGIEPTHPGEVATRYRYRDGAGEIGIIHSVSKPFCGGCTRARLSAEGRLYTCLFASSGADLREPLRAGASDAELREAVAAIWTAREDRYSQLRTEVSDPGADGLPTAGASGDPAGAQRGDPAGAKKVEMSYIGG